MNPWVILVYPYSRMHWIQTFNTRSSSLCCSAEFYSVLWLSFTCCCMGILYFGFIIAWGGGVNKMSRFLQWHYWKYCIFKQFTFDNYTVAGASWKLSCNDIDCLKAWWCAWAFPLATASLWWQHYKGCQKVQAAWFCFYSLLFHHAKQHIAK